MKNLQLNHNAHRPSEQKHPICFLANDINTPTNVGSLFRIADALGVEKVYLTGGSAIPPNTKIRKTSRSTEKYVPYIYENNPLNVVKALKKNGYKIVSLEITSSSIDIKNFSIKKSEKICLILGSENKGICQELLNISDVAIHIPMLGVSSSMNIAAACSIATYEIIRRF